MSNNAGTGNVNKDNRVSAGNRVNTNHRVGKNEAVIEEMSAAEYIRELAVGAYMLVVFIAVPLLLRDKYSQVGTFKYQIFRMASLIGFGVIFVTHVSVLIYFRNRKRQKIIGIAGWKAYLADNMSVLDWMMIGYGISVLISFAFSVDRSEAFWGARGWYMGLMSQLIFVVSYFVVSRLWSGGKGVWYGACGAAFIILLLGALCRFSIDPFNLYEGLPENTVRTYISLLGQNTWYSSYMCTLFPLGLFFFWGTGAEESGGLLNHLLPERQQAKDDKQMAQKKHGKKGRTKKKRDDAVFLGVSKIVVVRLAGALFCIAGFSSWVTQNSDSAYIALTLILLTLFCYGFTSNVWMERFFQVVLLMLVSFIMTGFFQDWFPEQAILPEELSLFLSKSIVTIVSFIVVCVLYVLFLAAQHRGLQIQRWSWISRIAVILFIMGIAAGILLIIYNTKGYLADWFGFSSQNNYLLFDDAWGNGRGRTWKYCVQVFKELPFFRKLFGVGPDCFSVYGYRDPVYAEWLVRIWPGNTLTNAHCEWLNSLICCGIVGTVFYIGIFVSGVIRFARAGKRQPVLIMIVLSLLAYTGHNMFCYQQALCTPFLFLILGMGERLLQLDETI